MWPRSEGYVVTYTDSGRVNFGRVGHLHVLLAKGGMEGGLREVLEMTAHQHAREEGALLLLLGTQLHLVFQQVAQIQ